MLCVFVYFFRQVQYCEANTAVNDKFKHMRIKQSLKVLSLTIALMMPVQGEELRVLLIDGISNHNSETRVSILRGIITQDPNIELDISMTPTTANSPDWVNWRPHFEKYDVVISGYNDIGIANGLRWPSEVEQAFSSDIENGGGFMAFHEANNAFDDWAEYNEMIGLGWRRANQGDSLRIGNDESIIEIPSGTAGPTRHGARRDLLVTRRADNHPIYKGLPDQWFAADLELYRYARGPEAIENVEVLTYGRDLLTGFDFPVEWATQYGEGRVYVSTYGHVWHDQSDPAGMRCAAFQTVFHRALYWLGGQTPSEVVPDDFPSATEISLRDFVIDQSPFDIESTVLGNVFGIDSSGAYNLPTNVRTDRYSENIGDAITPFVVKINGDNDFTVMAVGDPYSSYESGTVINKFSQAQTIIISVDPNEKIAIGFIDSEAPYFSGRNLGSVAYTHTHQHKV